MVCRFRRMQPVGLGDFYQRCSPVTIASDGIALSLQYSPINQKWQGLFSDLNLLQTENAGFWPRCTPVPTWSRMVSLYTGTILIVNRLPIFASSFTFVLFKRLIVGICPRDTDYDKGAAELRHISAIITKASLVYFAWSKYIYIFIYI